MDASDVLSQENIEKHLDSLGQSETARHFLPIKMWQGGRECSSPRASQND